MLKAVGTLIKEHTRTIDISVRYGGEEFVVLLENCDLHSVKEKSESLRKMVEALKPKGISVTASIGLAQLKPMGEGFKELFERADKAVYQAKENGRNCVVASPDVHWSVSAKLSTPTNNIKKTA